jgi:hypothetical protein
LVVASRPSHGLADGGDVSRKELIDPERDLAALRHRAMIGEKAADLGGRDASMPANGTQGRKIPGIDPTLHGHRRHAQATGCFTDAEHLLAHITLLAKIQKYE